MDGGREGGRDGGREGGRRSSKGRRDGWSVDDICDCDCVIRTPTL